MLRKRWLWGLAPSCSESLLDLVRDARSGFHSAKNTNFRCAWLQFRPSWARLQRDGGHLCSCSILTIQAGKGWAGRCCCQTMSTQPDCYNLVRVSAYALLPPNLQGGRGSCGVADECPKVMFRTGPANSTGHQLHQDTKLKAHHELEVALASATQQAKRC